jgi:hypothetical protein
MNNARIGRLGAALAHLAISAFVAALAAALVFGLWYPGPYRQLSGGLSLFGLIVAVDIVLGPALTVVVFNPSKPRGELVRDLATIALAQILALGYGVYTMHQARPVHLVFEVDRFRVVSAADIDAAELAKAPEALQRLPLTGPTVISARRAQSSEEVLSSVNSASQGIEISMRPERWTAYGRAERAEALRRALRVPMPLPPELQRALKQASTSLGRNVEGLGLLPVQSRFGTWSAVLDERGEPLQLIPVDSFR